MMKINIGVKKHFFLTFCGANFSFNAPLPAKILGSFASHAVFSLIVGSRQKGIELNKHAGSSRLHSIVTFLCCSFLQKQESSEWQHDVGVLVPTGWEVN